MSKNNFTEHQSNNGAWAAKWSLIFAAISILALLSLHFLSPEFGPSWRMVSEYANGKFEWVLFIFFTCWGLSSWCAALFLWSYLTTIAGKTGVILLFISGMGEIMAAFFNVNHPLHGTSGTLGIPTFVIASLLISWNLKNKFEWIGMKKKLLWAAHASWISLVLVVITMVIMIVGFKNAGVLIGPGQQPPAAVPAGVIALVGYANRILILAFIYWILVVSNNYLAIFKAKTQTGEWVNG